jgi:hypothetical protein
MVAFTAGAVLTAANLNTAFNALTLRTVTGTSDTLVLADNGGGVTYSNASAITSTIPPNSSVAFAVGTKIVLINLGAGVVTVTAGAGVTINGATLTLAQNAGGTCIKTATNTWSFLPFSSGIGAAVYSDVNTGTYTGYAYKTFTASGTLTITTAGFADIVVCSGGGGGGSSGGGGGAGGVLQVTNAYLPVGTLTVTVGAGGAVLGVGQPSRIGSYYSVGGLCAIDRLAISSFGGSGSGGSYGSYSGYSGTAGIGNNGGNGAANASGGGGGAGAVGANAVSTTGGAGGAGTTTSIAGTTPSGAYVAGNYALGGGGGGYGSGSGGTGGSGGGGNGGGTATAGTANTGGGGGSGSTNAAGGSGIVIVRVAV